MQLLLTLWADCFGLTACKPNVQVKSHWKPPCVHSDNNSTFVSASNLHKTNRKLSRWKTWIYKEVWGAEQNQQLELWDQNEDYKTIQLTAHVSPRSVAAESFWCSGYLLTLLEGVTELNWDQTGGFLDGLQQTWRSRRSQNHAWSILSSLLLCNKTVFSIIFFRL